MCSSVLSSTEPSMCTLLWCKIDRSCGNTTGGLQGEGGGGAEEAEEKQKVGENEQRKASGMMLVQSEVKM